MLSALNRHVGRCRRASHRDAQRIGLWLVRAGSLGSLCMLAATCLNRAQVLISELQRSTELMMQSVRTICWHKRRRLGRFLTGGGLGLLNCCVESLNHWRPCPSAMKLRSHCLRCIAAIHPLLCNCVPGRDSVHLHGHKKLSCHRCLEQIGLTCPLYASFDNSASSERVPRLCNPLKAWC